MQQSAWSVRGAGCWPHESSDGPRVCRSFICSARIAAGHRWRPAGNRLNRSLGSDLDQYTPEITSADAAASSGVGALSPFSTQTSSPPTSTTSPTPSTASMMPAATGSQNPLSVANHCGTCTGGYGSPATRRITSRVKSGGATAATRSRNACFEPSVEFFVVHLRPFPAPLSPAIVLWRGEDSSSRCRSGCRESRQAPDIAGRQSRTPK